jgi:outer membrane receptor protein involved in Fe transport
VSWRLARGRGRNPFRRLSQYAVVPGTGRRSLGRGRPHWCQKVGLSGSYQLHPRLRGYVAIENLFDKRYEDSFGFPALPITARVGMHLTLGGGAAGRP